MVSKTPKTIPRVANAYGRLREPKAIASTIRSTVRFTQPTLANFGSASRRGAPLLMIGMAFSGSCCEKLVRFKGVMSSNAMELDTAELETLVCFWIVDLSREAEVVEVDMVAFDSLGCLCMISSVVCEVLSVSRKLGNFEIQMCGRGFTYVSGYCGSRPTKFTASSCMVTINFGLAKASQSTTARCNIHGIGIVCVCRLGTAARSDIYLAVSSSC